MVVVGSGGVVVGGGIGTRVVRGASVAGTVVTVAIEVAVVSGGTPRVVGAIVSGGASDAALLPHPDTTSASTARATVGQILLITNKVVHQPA